MISFIIFGWYDDDIFHISYYTPFLLPRCEIGILVIYLRVEQVVRIIRYKLKFKKDVLVKSYRPI